MRVLFCKIACPGFVCFCKPSQSIYTPGPLRLESAPRTPSSYASAPVNASSDTSSDPETTCSTTATQVTEGESAQVNGKQSNGDHNCLKSSIKRAADQHGSQDFEKKSKKVQWVDLIGKQLAEVREFESSEREDADNGYHSSRSCLCTIL